MELIFVSDFNHETDFSGNSYIIGRENNLGFPPSPVTVFGIIPKNKKIVYRIFSYDFSLSDKGIFLCNKLSEPHAVSLSYSSVIYEDSVSQSCYFRYSEENCQHTVWLEDFVHTVRKLFLLKNTGAEKIYIPTDEYSQPTISRIFSAYGNRI